MIRGVNHVTLAIGELDRSVRFYRDLLGFELVAHWPRGAYLAAGPLWLALVVDAEVRDGPLPEYTHLALDVAPEDFDAMAARVAAGARIWKDNASEGASLYFLDPDGHKLELHATGLADRLVAAREAPWEGLVVLRDD